jgi:SAM-dependent methyltransferase
MRTCGAVDPARRPYDHDGRDDARRRPMIAMTSFTERLMTPALRARWAELAAGSAELAVLAHLLGPIGTAYWVHSIGVCRDAQLARLLPPLAPAELRAAVAEPEPELFLATGLDDARRLVETVERFGGPAAPATAVLDFGAGCGRIARFLVAGGAGFRVHACDPDAAAMAWCAAHLPDVATAQSPRQPPLPYGDGAFDCVFAIGVFTQLAEGAGMRWLEELTRITRPGGLIAASLHGEVALATIAGSPRHQDVFRVRAPAARELLARLAAPAWLFVQHDAEGLRSARATGEYGVSFVGEAHVRERWCGPARDLLAHERAGLRGFDDFVVLRRRG